MAESTQIGQPALDIIGDVSAFVAGSIRPEQSFITALVEEAALESGDHLLDVGCGAGMLLTACVNKEPGAVLVGLDPDEDALELASRRIPRGTTPVELRQGVGQDMPFSDDCFDVVTATLFLRGLAPSLRSRVLDECFRVTKPAGRLLLADWKDEPTGLAALVQGPIRAVGRLLTRRPPRIRLRHQIEDAGFEPPERLHAFRTAIGTIDLTSTYKPGQRSMGRSRS